jgi:hypothetical protein
VSAVGSTSEWRRASIVFGAALAAVLFVYCHSMGRRSWSEEVQLSDGRTVEIDRYVKFDSSNSLAGDAFSSTDVVSTLRLKTDKSSSIPTWEVPLVPIVLYFDETTHEWVIVATTGSCETWAQRGSPNPPYWEYRLKNRSWTQVRVSDSSYGRKTNLFFDYEQGVPSQRLTMESKEFILSHNNFGESWRSVVAGFDSNCG